MYVKDYYFSIRINKHKRHTMKAVKLLLAFSISILSPYLSAQVSDDFSDGDISVNPVWSGDTNKVVVNDSLELQSFGDSRTDTLYLSTTFTQAGATEWRIYVRYEFAPSTSNFVRFYLQADQENLESALNGYFVQIGESGSNDSYDLYRQDSTNLTKIIDGIPGKATSEINGVIRVVRDTSGNWELSVDENQNNSFEVQGMVHDTSYSSGSHLGIWVKHSSTRNDAFFFDDVYAGEIIRDTIPPTALSVNIVSDTTLQLNFSEALDSISSVNVNNYQLSSGIGNPQSVFWEVNDPARVILTLPVSMINNTSYFLNILGVADTEGNVLTPVQILNFDYIEFSRPDFKDVIINEIMADPTPTQGLPEVEYLELYNRSSKTFDLAAWTISNGSTPGELPAFIFRPGTYLILTDRDDAGKYSTLTDVISPDRWPTLVNTGDNLGLRSVEGLIDTVDYIPLPGIKMRSKEKVDIL